MQRTKTISVKNRYQFFKILFFCLTKKIKSPVSFKSGGVQYALKHYKTSIAYVLTGILSAINISKVYKIPENIVTNNPIIIEVKCCFFCKDLQVVVSWFVLMRFPWDVLHFDY